MDRLFPNTSDHSYQPDDEQRHDDPRHNGHRLHRQILGAIDGSNPSRG